VKAVKSVYINRTSRVFEISRVQRGWDCVKNSILLDKSEENLEAANLLAKKKLYNAATNRIYYSIYQKIIYILDKDKINHKKAGFGSHRKSIEKLISTRKHLDDQTTLLEVWYVKTARRRCDYLLQSIDGKDYADIKPKAAIINEVLDKYI